MSGAGAPGVLAGVRVVEIGHPHTEYAGAVLAGQGADVYLIEPPEGSATRRRRPFLDGTANGSRRSIPFLARNLNKRSVVIDSGSPQSRALLTGLIERADVVIDTDASPYHRLVSAAATGVTRATITDSTGLGSSSIVPFAVSGGLASSGWPDRAPCNAPGWLVLDGASIYAACAAVASLVGVRRGAAPSAYEIPLAEAAVAAVTPWTRALVSYETQVAGQGPSTLRLGDTVYPFYRASDGYVRVLIGTPRQWDAFVELLGSPEDLLEGPWTDPLFRAQNADVLQLRCQEITERRTVSDLFHAGQGMGLTITPVNSLRDFRDDPHVQGRSVFVEVDDPEHGPMAHMRPPVLFSETSLNVAPAPAPALGQHQQEATELCRAPARPRPSPAVGSDPFQPLRGIRVLELGVGAVVPESAALLAAFGAEVLKIESSVHLDFLRRRGAELPGGADASPVFNQLNLSVKSLAVDLARPEGAGLVRRLAEGCQLVMENMRGGVMEKLGLDYDSLRQVRPDIIYLSSQGLGRGRYDNYQTYGPNLQTFSGVTSQWAHADDPFPVGTTLNHPDHTAGKQALVPLLGMLLRCLETGAGAHIEAAQVEGAAYLIGASFLAQQVAADRDLTPLGNTSPDFAPHGCYRCEGDDRWVAIAAETDSQWQALYRHVCQSGGATLGDAEKLERVAERLARGAELDEWLESWTRRRGAAIVERELRGIGVPVSRAATGQDIAGDEEAHRSGFYVELDHSRAGRHTYTGIPICDAQRRRPLLGPAPLLGEHTGLLGESLGLTDDELAELEAAGVIGC